MVITAGILIPFLGTTIGAVFVFFIKKGINPNIQRLLLGLASGVMIAASVWSLLIPAIESSVYLKKWAFVPAASGYLIGFIILILTDKIVVRLQKNIKKYKGTEGKLCHTSKSTLLLVIAVTLHNIPEGMAVGVVFAGLLANDPNITLSGAMATAIGIAIQNIPEGAVISMPLLQEGNSKLKAFIYGVLSGIVEPVAAGLTLLICHLITGMLPYLLAFAAGAMMFVVAKELLPEASEEEKSYVGAIGYAIGFLIMMSLDVALG